MSNNNKFIYIASQSLLQVVYTVELRKKYSDVRLHVDLELEI